MNRRTALLASLAALACAAAALASTAAAHSGRIVMGRSIAPVAIGDERAVVEGLIGPGRIIARTPDPGRPANRNLDRVTVAYGRVGLVVRFGTDEASSTARLISTRAPGYRTAGGVGVGVTTGVVLSRFPRALCGAADCTIARANAPGLTRLDLRAGRVVRVVILSPLPR